MELKHISHSGPVVTEFFTTMVQELGFYGEKVDTSNCVIWTVGTFIQIGEMGYVIIGRGDSRRHPDDKNDPAYGDAIAYSRAMANMSRRLTKVVEGQIRHADINAATVHKTLAQWEEEKLRRGLTITEPDPVLDALLKEETEIIARAAQPSAPRTRDAREAHARALGRRPAPAPTLEEQFAQAQARARDEAQRAREMREARLREVREADEALAQQRIVEEEQERTRPAWEDAVANMRNNGGLINEVPQVFSDAFAQIKSVTDTVSTVVNEGQKMFDMIRATVAARRPAAT